MTITRNQLVTDTDNSYNFSIIFGSMPDYSRAIMFYELYDNPTSNLGFPIWKIQVPGYLLSYCGTNYQDGCNLDVNYAISYTWEQLQRQDSSGYTQHSKCVLLGTVSSDESAGGSTGPQPIYPGSSTYMTLTGASTLSGVHCFIPCKGVPSIIDPSRFIISSGYTVQQKWNADMNNGAKDYLSLIRPIDEKWNVMFDGNWQDNFPDIDFSKI